MGGLGLAAKYTPSVHAGSGLIIKRYGMEVSKKVRVLYAWTLVTGEDDFSATKFAKRKPKGAGWGGVRGWYENGGGLEHRVRTPTSLKIRGERVLGGTRPRNGARTLQKQQTFAHCQGSWFLRALLR